MNSWLDMCMGVGATGVAIFLFSTYVQPLPLNFILTTGIVFGFIGIFGNALMTTVQRYKEVDLK